MTKTLINLTDTRPFCMVGIVLLVLTMGLSSPGCGDSQTATDQDEITRFLNENPDAQNPQEETSDLKSNEYKGIVRTREKV